MKISGLQVLHADGGWRVLSFLKLTTDTGLVGWSEFYDGFGVGGCAALIELFRKQVIGQDPMAVGRLSSTLHALSRLTPGGVTHQAIAAIENACLDIKGKALGVPVAALLGGPYRDRIPLYWSHCGYFRAVLPGVFSRLGHEPIRTLDDVKALGGAVAARGFKALKTNPIRFADGLATAFNPGFYPDRAATERNLPGQLVGATRALIDAFREGCGPDVAILLDLNFTLRADGYLHAGRELESLGLQWLEIDHPDPQALRRIRDALRTPVASLESIYGVDAYRRFLERSSVDVAIIDVVWNGALESARIAALADAFDVSIAPHNFYGELGSAISAQLCAAVPNVRIMEFEVDDAPWRADFVVEPLVIEQGELVLTDRPGWGVEINEDGIRQHPVRT